MSAITWVFVTLGATDFVEFMAAFFICTTIGMSFRLYIMPIWKFAQENIEESIKVFKKMYVMKQKQKETSQSLFDPKDTLKKTMTMNEQFFKNSQLAPV